MPSTNQGRSEEMKLVYGVLKRNDRLLTMASRLAKVGAWRFDVEKMEGQFSDEIYRMYEVDPSSDAEKQKWKPLIQKQASEVYAAAKKIYDPETRTYSYDFDTITAKGNLRHLKSTGSLVMESDRAVQVEDIYQDVTGLINATEIAQHKDNIIDALLRSTPDLFFLVDMDGTTREYRAKMGNEKDLYLPPELFLNKKMQDVLPPHIGEQFDQNMHLAQEQGEASFGYELEVAFQMLDSAGMAVTIAENGERAVEAAGTGDYDLILMDIQMPVMGGLQAARAIRLVPHGANVPILAMTANAFEENRQKCLLAGMNDHIAKPVEIDDHYAHLIKWLPVRRGSAAEGGRIPQLPARLPM